MRPLSMRFGFGWAVELADRTRERGSPFVEVVREASSALAQ